MNYRGKFFLALFLTGAAALLLVWQNASLFACCKESDLTTVPQTVWSLAAESMAGDTPQKRVCLTFDDGPSKITQEILEILAKEKVPATFFVVSADNNKNYLPLIAQEAAAGHQIALHSASHSYRRIYASPAAFWQDIKALRQAISPYVDVDTIHWLRFPGGSTNTVSHKYGGSGIMKILKNQAEEKGYRYLDWNVCAEDAAGGRPSAQQILRNIQKDTGDKTDCVVLMHDTAATGTTVQALPQIIRWYREQGYQFCRVDEMFPTEI